MKIRYLGHSCIELFGKDHILIDPNFDVKPRGDIDFICVTHEHQDHFDFEKFKSLSGELLAPRTVLEMYSLSGRKIRAGMRIANLEIHESHCFRALESYSFLVKDEKRLLHSGDSAKLPDVKADIIFSACFPSNYKDYLREFKRLKPELVIPIHYKREKIEDALGLVEELKKVKINSKILKVSEYFEV
ncbi:MAG: MBL fold metallo-hydrolase [Candidatus Methanofastidiosia archaeon]